MVLTVSMQGPHSILLHPAASVQHALMSGSTQDASTRRLLRKSLARSMHLKLKESRVQEEREQGLHGWR